jgi:twitching motility protein PilI
MSKRISLREFQQNLTTRLGNAKHGDSARVLLGVESGHSDQRYWLIDLTDSGEVIPLSPLTPVPLTRPWFAGITNVRGLLYSVIDFSAFRHGAATPHNTESRLVMVGARHGINSAILVDRALGLRPLDEMTRLADDDTSPAWGRQRYEDNNGREWRRLHVTELLTDDRFLDVTA